MKSVQRQKVRLVTTEIGQQGLPWSQLGQYTYTEPIRKCIQFLLTKYGIHEFAYKLIKKIFY